MRDTKTAKLNSSATSYDTNFGSMRLGIPDFASSGPQMNASDRKDDPRIETVRPKEMAPSAQNEPAAPLFRSSLKEEIRALVGDLFELKPVYYWIDFLSFTVLGWTGFLLSLHSSVAIHFKIIGMIVAIFSMYRSVALNHDMIHNDKRFPKGLVLAWHLLSGIPLGAPLFMYKRLHLSHHSKRVYASSMDPEYANFGNSWRDVIGFAGASFVVPVLSWFRFLILAPLSLPLPRLRKLVRTKASSIGIRLVHTRELPKDSKEMRAWNIEEFSTSAWNWLLFIGWTHGLVPTMYFVHWYFLIAGILSLNAVRALAVTHAYSTKRDQDISEEDQVRDSFNLDGSSLLGILLCPMGLRYHALHHLFPTMPYHSLGMAHRRLVKMLPSTSIYHQTRIKSVGDGLRRVFRSRPVIPYYPH